VYVLKAGPRGTLAYVAQRNAVGGGGAPHREVMKRAQICAVLRVWRLGVNFAAALGC
jgi:hypothetical protein